MDIADLLIRSYGNLYNRNYIPTPILSLFRFIVRHVANFIIPIYYKKSRRENIRKNTIKREKEIVISLTSFPARIEKVWIVIESLKRQSIAASRIILWLSKVQFPGLLEDLPQSLRNMIGNGFEVRFVEHDLRSHKKYYYAFKEYPNSIIILVDDDIFYPSTLLEDLLYNYTKFPNSIICRYGLVMSYDNNNNLLPYSEWNRNYGLLCNHFFFGSGGGTLIEPRLLINEVLNESLFMKLTPFADDIWLNAMAHLSNLNVMAVSKKLLMPVMIKNNLRLTQVNVYDNKNDKQINEIIKYYSSQGLYPFAWK